MMYLSHTNDGPNKKAEDILITVVLDNETLNNIKQIKQICANNNFPYQANYQFTFPTDKVRLMEPPDIDDCLEDYHVYTIKNGEDPLEYYRCILHEYRPKEDFWICQKPYSVTLNYHGGNSFGFDATIVGIDISHYYGYTFNWTF